MAAVDKTDATGGVIQSGVIHVLQDGDTGNPNVLVVVICALRQDDEVGGGHPFGVPMSGHREAVNMEGIQGMGDTGG